MKLAYKRMVEGLAHADPAEQAKAKAGIDEAFKDKAARDNFDMGRLFEEAFGWQEFRACKSDRRSRPVSRVFEAAGAVNTAAFADIIGQWAFNDFIEAYNAPEYVFSAAIPKRPSDLKWERIPGIAEIGDEALVVDEAKAYPLAGVGQDWQETPETLKRGFIVPVTWEAIFFDRTGRLRERATGHTKSMAQNREKRAVDCAIDAGETATNKYRYRWKGDVIATYGDNSGTHSWDNLSASTPLTDYTSINAVWSLFQGMTDPYTGEPIMMTIKDIVVPPALTWTLPAVMGGQVNRLTPGYATTGNPINTNYANPAGTIVGTPRVLSNQYLRTRGGSDSTWYVGDVAAAFEYIENLAPEVTTAPAGNEEEFTKDIVLRTKVREMGTFHTKNPRFMVKATA